jgi:hypothetical protein
MLKLLWCWLWSHNIDRESIYLCKTTDPDTAEYYIERYGWCLRCARYIKVKKRSW